MQPLVCTASEARCRPFLHDLRRKKAIFAAVNDRPIDIHTHRPTAAQTIRCVGIHPWQAAATDALPATFEEAAAAADAVGEIGLDFARREVDPARQLRLFRAQLDTAERLGKPIVLHIVRAFEEAMRELRRRRLAGVILHGFVGSKEQAARAVAAGYFLSFGARTAASKRTIEALRATPLDRLFVETDDSPIPIERILAQVADLRGVPPETLLQAVRTNYERLFGTQHG